MIDVCIYTENSSKCFTLCNKRILRNTNIDDPINEKENGYKKHDKVSIAERLYIMIK